MSLLFKSKMTSALHSFRSRQRQCALHDYWPGMLRLRAAMEEAVSRASTQQVDDMWFVDRRLVTKLLINYMGSPSSQQKEILEVMARILQFDEGAKQQVGLIQSSAWSSFLPFGFGGNTTTGEATSPKATANGVRTGLNQFLPFRPAVSNLYAQTPGYCRPVG